MRTKIALTKNVERLWYSARILANSAHGIERMGLVSGVPGEGKSVAMDFVVDQMDGISLRIMQCTTVTSLLASLATELRVSEKIRKSNRTAVLFQAVIDHLNERPRIIFVDEIDRVFAGANQRNGNNIIEILRDVHDVAHIPLILVGEENSAIAIQESGRFARRITQWVNFSGIDRDDARIVADTVAEVRIADDLLDHLYAEAGANIGRVIVGIDALERHGKDAGLEEVTLETWGNGALFFDQKNFRKRGRS